MEVRVKQWSAQGRHLAVERVETSPLHYFFDSVTLNYLRAKPQSPQTSQERSLTIHFWSAPEKTETVLTPSRLAGINLPSHGTAMLSSGRGVSYYLDENYAVAEYLPGNLYIHHNLFRHGTAPELLLFEMILDWLMTVVAWESQGELQSDCWVESIGEFSPYSVQLKSTKTQEEQTLARLVSSSRQVTQYKRSLQGANSQTVVADEVFDVLWNFDGLAALMVHQDKVFLFHDPVTYDATDHSERLIGAYRIVAPLGNGDKFELRNLSVRPGGSQHPHFTSHPCLGDFSRSFSDAKRSEDYLTSAQTALLFVECVKERDVLKSVFEWPMV